MELHLFLAYTLNQWKRTAFAQQPECTKKVYKITERIVRQGRRLNHRPNWWKQIYDLHYLRRMWKLGVRVSARSFINSSKYSGVSTGVLASVHVNVFSHLACTKKSWNIHEKMNRLMKKKRRHHRWFDLLIHLCHLLTNHCVLSSNLTIHYNNFKVSAQFNMFCRMKNADILNRNRPA